MRIVVDGNDGTGKTSLIRELTRLGYTCQDRGLPTHMTDDPTLKPTDDHELYLILDAPVEVCRARLAVAGRDLTEQYHTVADLQHYRQRFLEVAATIPTATVVDANRPLAEVVADCVEILREKL
jgi:thymidylate kinase